MLGPDLFNGTVAQLAQFGTSIGATFPLLLDGSLGAGDQDLLTVYGDREDYAVINKVGIVRYNAYDLWPYGDRFHLDELRATIDSLVSPPTAVDGAPTPRTFALTAAPNPFRGSVRLELSHPASAPAPASVVVYDLAGREIATLWRAALAQPTIEIQWDGTGRDGARAAPGLYLVRAEVGGVRLTRRILLAR